MPRTHLPYTPEFRRRMVELVRSARSPESLAEEYEPSAPSIRNWVSGARSTTVTSYPDVRCGDPVLHHLQGRYLSRCVRSGHHRYAGNVLR